MAQLGYVSPTGKTPPGYNKYFTDVGEALNWAWALTPEIEIVLEVSKNHSFNIPAGIFNKTYIVRNEDNSEDYNSCIVTVANNCSLQSTYATANITALFKGITFTGPTHSYSYMNAVTMNRASFMQFNGNMAANITFQGVCWKNLSWAAGHENTGARGLAFSLNTPGTAIPSSLKVINCRFENLQGVPGNTSNSSWSKMFTLTNIDNTYWENCTFKNCGKADRTSALQGGFGAITVVKNTKNVWTNCHWEDIYCLHATDLTNEVPDGSVICSPFDVTGFITYLKFNDCSFTRCEAGKSGAVHVGRGATLEMYRCKFEQCYARGTLGGGATGRGGVDIPTAVNNYSLYKSCEFVNCHAPNGLGGAIRGIWTFNDVKIDNCTFKDCTALAANAVGIPRTIATYNTNGFKIRNCTFYSTSGLGAQIAVDVATPGPYGLDLIENCFSVNGNADFISDTVVPIGTIFGDPKLDANNAPVWNSPLTYAGNYLGYSRDFKGNQFHNPPSIGALEYEQPRSPRA